MAVSEEVKARRKATNARWKALYKAAHGTYPELDIRLSEDEDLDSKFVQEDGEADEQAPTDERQVRQQRKRFRTPRKQLIEQASSCNVVG